jgi:hypothetical protein
MNDMALLERPDRVIAKAWADEDFKSALLADPRAALRTQGIEIPEGITVRVVENSDNVINLVLPKAPDLPLLEEALDSLEGLNPPCGGGCRCGGCGGCGGGCVACTCVVCSCV